MKRLVICCDGTWQRLYAGALTNVALALLGLMLIAYLLLL